MQLWEYKEHTKEEIRQRQDEGGDSHWWEEERTRLLEVAPEDDEAWRGFYERLYATPYAAPADAREPSALEDIRALRPDGPRCLPVGAAQLPDKMLGAWLGRIAGCILGKPVEGRPKSYIDGYLQVAGQEDLTGFFPKVEWPGTLSGEPATPPGWESCMEGHITCAERDDDIDYTILGLHYLEKSGPDFTAQNVADEWLNLLPYGMVYTAEHVAYRNLVNGILPPESAETRNPYREWIGAQIRADAFGYVNAGSPERAAAFAFRDASVSHVKNGIYGEMWAAATIAAAFATDDVRIALEAGLAEIPAESRLAEAGRRMLAWSAEFPDWQDCWACVRQHYGNLHWVHTINNACWVMLGLLYGEKDFGRTITLAVRCGDDTDCNGATAGSILGAMLGAKGIPARWKDPFQDCVQSAVQGFASSRISDLATRTLAQYEKVKNAASDV